jgi:hypothetical protein
MGITVSRAVGRKGAKIAHMKIGMTILLTVLRKRTVLVDILFHQ